MTPTHFADRLRSAATSTRVPARISRRRRTTQGSVESPNQSPSAADPMITAAHGGEQFAARLRAALPAKAGVRR